MPAIIECFECGQQFDVEGIPPGKAIRCASCKAIIEVPDVAAMLGGDDEPDRAPDIEDRAPRRRERDPDRRPSGRREAARGKDRKDRKERGKERGKTERRGRQTTRRGGRGLERSEAPSNPTPKILAGAAILAVLAIGGLVATMGGDDGPRPVRDDTASGSTAGDGSPAAPGVREALATRTKAAGDDNDKLFAVARWAGEQGLDAERDALLARIVEDDPDHAQANQALGRVQHDGEWMTKAERDAKLAKKQQAGARFREILGEDMLTARTPRFQIFMQRSGFLDEEDEKAKFDTFVGKLNSYCEGWWERWGKQLPAASNGTLTDPSKLPVMRIALVTDQEAYAALAEQHAPRARIEAGFHQKGTDIIWSFHNAMSEVPPFYDSFLFAVYTRQWDADKGRTPEEYIIWRKGHDAFTYLGLDVQVAVNEHWLVALERGGPYDAVKLSRRNLAALEAVFDFFEAQYSEVMKSRGEMPLVPIYIFKDRAGYLRYGKKSGSEFLSYTAGHYDPGNKLMMTFHFANNEQDPIGVFLHEGTHVLMHYLCRFRPPTAGDLFWLQEGIADFCAGYEVKGDQIIIGKPNKSRIQQFRMYKMMANIKFVKLRPLKELLRFTIVDFANMMQGQGDPQKKSMQMGVLYTQCWALYHFLHHYDDGKYRAKLKQLIRRVLEKGSTFKDWEAVFGSDVDLDAMDKELTEYMKTLTK